MVCSIFVANSVLLGKEDTMSEPTTVREYIGARYVPIFANPLEWDNTKTYEPLTIVTYQGNSYTSTQFVPTGITIDNTEFWALTGNYNAQIEAYRQEVANLSNSTEADFTEINTQLNSINTDINSINTDIADINGELENLINSEVTNQKIIVIGDSFSKYPDNLTKSWVENFQVMRKEEVISLAVNGCGFLQAGSGGKSLPQQAQEAVTTYGNDNVSHIIVYGGVNDAYEKDNIVNAIKGMVSTLQAGFPKTRLIFILGNAGVTGGNSRYNGWYECWESAYSEMYQQSYTTNVTFDKGWNILRPYARIAFSSDDLHPNSFGAACIAQYINNLIEGHENTNNFIIHPAWTQVSSGLSITQEDIRLDVSTKGIQINGYAELNGNLSSTGSLTSVQSVNKVIGMGTSFNAHNVTPLTFSRQDFIGYMDTTSWTLYVQIPAGSYANHKLFIEGFLPF